MRVILGILLLQATVLGQDQSALFNRPVAESNPLRTEQARELDAYIKIISKDRSLLKSVLNPDYSSQVAFEKSVVPYRKAFCNSIGYPPPAIRPE